MKHFPKNKFIFPEHCRPLSLCDDRLRDICSKVSSIIKKTSEQDEVKLSIRLGKFELIVTPTIPYKLTEWMENNTAWYMLPN